MLHIKFHSQSQDYLNLSWATQTKLMYYYQSKQCKYHFFAFLRILEMSVKT